VNTSEAMSEGFPNTFIQAWARGVPVLSLDVNPDALLDGERLGVFCDGSIDQMQAHLGDLLKSEIRREQIGHSARQFAQSTFGLVNCRKIEALIAA